jgi:hypothetical protein
MWRIVSCMRELADDEIHGINIYYSINNIVINNIVINNIVINNILFIMEEITYKHIIGYSIFLIHLLLCIILNFGWLFITNVFYLHILLFNQLVVLLSWKVFDGKCCISSIENSLLGFSDKEDSLTVKFLSNYFPQELMIKILSTSLIVAMFFTLLKKGYIKMNTPNDEPYL